MFRTLSCRLAAIAALTLPLSGFGAEAIAPAIPGEVVVKTPEDVLAGKQNVIGVAEQLRQLFAPTRKTRRTKPVPDEPYIKIVPGPNGRSTLIYRCRYNTASKLSSSIDALISDNGYVEPTTEQNLLIINDKSDCIKSIAEALPLIDVSSPQVLIEAKIVEVLLSDGMQRNLSVLFKEESTRDSYDAKGNPIKIPVSNSAGVKTTSMDPNNSSDGGKFDWVFSSGDKSVQTSFQWLLNALDAKVLSSPTIVVARNEESSISNGQDVPIQSQTNTNGSIQTSTTFKRVGVTLTVTPKMVNDGNVTLLVQPQVSNIQSYQTIAQGDTSYQVPVISVRSISSNVKLEDGQIVVMGGLYNNRESVKQERIPFLSDMPYFGEAFTSKYREKEVLQLLFFLRVRILTPEDLADGVLFDPDENARMSDAIGDAVRQSPALPQLQNTVEQVKHEFIDRNMSKMD